MKPRSLFVRHDLFMASKPEPVAVKPQPRGIIERLKSLTPDQPEAVFSLIVEFGTYKQASPKTARRFLRVLKSKASEKLTELVGAAVKAQEVAQ